MTARLCVNPVGYEKGGQPNHEEIKVNIPRRALAESQFCTLGTQEADMIWKEPNGKNVSVSPSPKAVLVLGSPPLSYPTRITQSRAVIR